MTLVAMAVLAGAGLVAATDPASAHANHWCTGAIEHGFRCSTSYDPGSRERNIRVYYHADGVVHRSGYVSVDHVGGAQYELTICDETGADGRSLILRIHGDRTLDYRDPDGGGGRCGVRRIFYPWASFRAVLSTTGIHDDHASRTYGKP